MRGETQNGLLPLTYCLVPIHVFTIDDAVLVEDAKDRFYNALVDEAENEEADMMPFEDLIAAAEADETE